MITQAPFIKVSVIKAKHLKQVRSLLHTLNFHQMVEDLMAERLKVRFWFHGNAVGLERVTKLWLIEGPNAGEWSYGYPPDPMDLEGRPVADYIEVLEKYKDVPQIFAD
jgi:hypothetical protein